MTTQQSKELNLLVTQKDWWKIFRFIRSCWNGPSSNCDVEERSIHEGRALVLEALDTTGKNGKTIQIVSQHPDIMSYVSRVKANYLRLAVPVEKLEVKN